MGGEWVGVGAHFSICKYVFLLCMLDVNVLQTSCSLENGKHFFSVENDNENEIWTAFQKKKFKKINISGKKTSTQKKIERT